MKTKYVGDGKVYLIAGGGKVYTDIAARFVRSERPVSEIIESPYSKEIVQHILSSGHLAALEFDYFLFGVEGYSRVTETQLVRKRMASYMIKSGRAELNGKRSYSTVIPKQAYTLDVASYLEEGEKLYNKLLELGVPEESARYIKPQATEFKGIIGMNAHALLDFFAVRCCMNAQEEIRDMAYKMLSLCKKACPDLFANAGPNCFRLGYCPENERKNANCHAAMTKDQAFTIFKLVRKLGWDKYVNEWTEEHKNEQD